MIAILIKLLIFFIVFFSYRMIWFEDIFTFTTAIIFSIVKWAFLWSNRLFILRGYPWIWNFPIHHQVSLKYFLPMVPFGTLNMLILICYHSFFLFLTILNSKSWNRRKTMRTVRFYFGNYWTVLQNLPGCRIAEDNVGFGWDRPS
jgi:hypothetical protein